MISEREKYERFENYLKGTMDEVSKTSFEKELDNDKKLYQEFLEYRQAHNLIFESRLLDIKQELQSIHAYHLKVRRLWRNTGGIIIVTGLILTAIFLYKHFNIKKESSKDTVTDITASDSLQSGNNAVGMSVDAIPAHKTITDRLNRPDTQTVRLLPSAEKQAVIEAGPVNEIVKREIPALLLKTDSVSAPVRVSQDDEMKKEKRFIDCEQVEIKCDFKIENTCAGRSEGKINFLNQTLKGGVPPYEFSINNGASYFNHALFINLQEGTYRLLIRDGNHCTSFIGSAEVVGYECDFRFAPALGEVWDIPFISENEGVLRILTKDGKLLYVSEVGQYSKKQWDGRAQNGDLLPLGVYLFAIELADGTRYNGTVTIIK